MTRDDESLHHDHPGEEKPERKERTRLDSRVDVRDENVPMTEALNGALGDDRAEADRLVGYLIDDVIRNLRGSERVEAREVMGEVYEDLMTWIRKESVEVSNRWAAFKTAKMIARRKLGRANHKEKRHDEYRRGAQKTMEARDLERTGKRDQENQQLPELFRPANPEDDELTVTKTVSVLRPNWLQGVGDDEIVAYIALLKEEIHALDVESGRRPEILTYLDDLLKGTVPDLGSVEALEERYGVKSPRTLVNWRNHLSNTLRSLIDRSQPTDEQAR